MSDAKIHVLRDDVVGKIAAGEVVERPASVVKELVENSIDAGADSIEIEVQSAGQALIRVADNGEGMSQDDAKAACLRHSTSKIRDITDLDRLNTLGFRGEALSSIAAVSQMDLTSRTGTEEAGIYVYLESGEILKMRPAGRSKGTTVEVRNLFYNVPARRKFLKRESTELAEIANIVSRFIVSYPSIEFKLTHGDRMLMHAAKNMTGIERIRSVFGADVADHMTEFSSSSGKYGASGFMSRPSATRKDKRAQMFFVNGRFVRNKHLSDAVYEAYRSLLERHRHPAVILFLNVDPSEVDVNVHPTKLLVKFDDEPAMKAAVTGAIRDSFGEIEATPSGAMAAVVPPAMVEEEEGESPGREVIPETTGVQTEFGYAIDKKVPSAERSVANAWLSLSEMASPEAKREDIYQIGGCYIVRIGEEKITVTDQHAAHERVLFEYFSKAAGESSVEAQNLLFPARLDLSAGESLVMEKVIDKFAGLGFQIEPFGERSYVVQAIPAMLRYSDIKKVVYDILVDLSSCDLNKADINEELIKLTSCRAAIKAGDPLNREEMVSLLEQLKKCSLPFTCPHGRPTTLDITVDELEKRFRRK